jgi:hypothetical protein
MNSCISARIQCTANDTRRTPWSGIEALHGLHQADVAFLDQVAHLQAVAVVATGDVDDEAQVRVHQFAGGVEVFLRRGSDAQGPARPRR